MANNSLILLAHGYNSAAHHFLIGWAVLNDALFTLHENVRTKIHVLIAIRNLQETVSEDV